MGLIPAAAEAQGHRRGGGGAAGGRCGRTCARPLRPLFPKSRDGRGSDMRFSSPLPWRGARAGGAERLSDLDDDELDEYIQKGVKGDKDDIKIEALGGGGEDDDDEVRPCPPPLPPTHPVAGPFARGAGIRGGRRRPHQVTGRRAAAAALCEHRGAAHGRRRSLT